jgi:hypothetical protein
MTPNVEFGTLDRILNVSMAETGLWVGDVHALRLDFLFNAD